MPSPCFRNQFVVLLAMCLVFLISDTRATDTDPDGALYQPSENPLADVRQAISRADEGGKRALIVMGANWCHDSRALASRLNRSPLTEVIEQNYELVMVDVGFYQDMREITTVFGVSNYYATPTVLIIDPATGQLVDNEERHIWGNAYRIDMDESVEYFEKWAAKGPVEDLAGELAELDRLYAEIAAFETQMAERVATGYTVVGPMLALYKEGNAPEEFDASWNELSRFRNAIPYDVQELRDEAQRRVAKGEQGIQLEYPEYEALSWESEAQ